MTTDVINGVPRDEFQREERYVVDYVSGHWGCSCDLICSSAMRTLTGSAWYESNCCSALTASPPRSACRGRQSG